MLPTEWKRTALAALAAFVVGVWAASCWPTPEPTAPVAQWRAEAQEHQRQAKRLGETLLLMADSARRETQRADSAEARATRADRTRLRAEGKVAVLRESLKTDSTVRDSVVTLVQVVAQQDTVIQTYEVAFQGMKEAAARLRGANTQLLAANDSLSLANERSLALLRQGLTVVPKPCKVLWMDCPSRTTSFLVGAALGVAGTVALGAVTP